MIFLLPILISLCQLQDLPEKNQSEYSYEIVVNKLDEEEQKIEIEISTWVEKEDTPQVQIISDQVTPFRHSLAKGKHKVVVKTMESNTVKSQILVLRATGKRGASCSSESKRAIFFAGPGGSCSSV